MTFVMNFNYGMLRRNESASFIALFYFPLPLLVLVQPAVDILP